MRKIIPLGILAALLTLLVALPVSAGGHAGDPPGLAKAIAAKNAHVDELLSINGVVGAGVGLSGGRAAIVVFTEAAGVAGIPRSLDGVQVKINVSGRFTKLAPGPCSGPPAGRPPECNNEDDGGNGKVDPKDRFDRPVPIGISIGNAKIGNVCTAGTLGARVKDNAGKVYVLSNYHVLFAGSGAVGDNVTQPGGLDTNCSISASDVIATVGSGFDNKLVDAALALIVGNSVGNATPSDGYGTPKSDPVGAVIGESVQKYGRTSSLTKGEILVIDWSGTVGGDPYEDQIVVYSSKKPFVKSGDSGSLVVTDPDNEPVGLLFAGTDSGKYGIVNEIDNVLDALGVTIDGA